MEKEIKIINKNGEEVAKNISYILQIIDSARFMTRSLSNPADNLSDGILKLNKNTDMMIKNAKFSELNISIATVFLNPQTLKMI